MFVREASFLLHSLLAYNFTALPPDDTVFLNDSIILSNYQHPHNSIFHVARSALNIYELVDSMNCVIAVTIIANSHYGESFTCRFNCLFV